MQTTTNYGFKKPDKTDFYNVNDQNFNSDLLDAKLKEVEENNNITNTALSSHTGNKSNPHDVTKSQVGLSNVPNVSTNDQTPTYTVASANTALTSGEKLSVSFGKIAKAINSLISHLSDTVGHITSAERTAWNSKANQTSVDSIVNGSTAVGNATNATNLDGLPRSNYLQYYFHIGGENGGSYGSGIDLNTVYSAGVHEFAGNFRDTLNTPVGWYGDLSLLVIGRGANTTQLVQIGDTLCYRQSAWDWSWGAWHYARDSVSVKVQETAPSDTSALWIW